MSNSNNAKVRNLFENGVLKFCKRCGVKSRFYSKSSKLCDECYYKAVKYPRMKLKEKK